MPKIKAIETRYGGYRFRSRLEARWAVFLDAMGVTWEYEREGFDLGEGGYYLPDFWVKIDPDEVYEYYPEGRPPTAGWYVEIKPVQLTNREELLCGKLAKNSGHVVYALAGNPWPGEFFTYKWNYKTGQGGVREQYKEYYFDWCYWSPFLFYLCSNAARKISGDWPGRKELDSAFLKARSARFEFGEAP